MPNKILKRADNVKEDINTNRLPYTSAIRPKGYELKARPAMKLDVKIPACTPAVSGVRCGIKCNTMYAE